MLFLCLIIASLSSVPVEMKVVTDIDPDGYFTIGGAEPGQSAYFGTSLRETFETTGVSGDCANCEFRVTRRHVEVGAFGLLIWTISPAAPFTGYFTFAIDAALNVHGNTSARCEVLSPALGFSATDTDEWSLSFVYQSSSHFAIFPASSWWFGAADSRETNRGTFSDSSREPFQGGESGMAASWDLYLNGEPIVISSIVRWGTPTTTELSVLQPGVRLGETTPDGLCTIYGTGHSLANEAMHILVVLGPTGNLNMSTVHKIPDPVFHGQLFERTFSLGEFPLTYGCPQLQLFVVSESGALAPSPETIHLIYRRDGVVDVTGSVTLPEADCAEIANPPPATDSPTATGYEEKPKSDGPSLGLIIGVSVAGVVVLCAIIVGIVLWRRAAAKVQNAPEVSTPGTGGDAPGQPVVLPGQAPPGYAQPSPGY